MAYNTKYRVTFKDFYGTTIQADIQQDGWSVGNVTDVTPTDNPLVIEWPGERDDIFNPVRGAVATLSFYATSTGQFDEFFDANTKEYMLVVTKGGSTYWRGWLTLGDYQESLQYPPYMVSVKAYDLGYLQDKKWDTQYHTDDTILDVIYRIIGYTGLDIGVIERVNIYEDSIASTASDSMLDLINIHECAFIDDSWQSISCYEALGRLLEPFNAFVMQEDDVWNICRVADMRVSHNQRTFAYPQLLTTSGSEDLTSDLSNYSQMDRSAIMMACPNYRSLIFTQDCGAKNLVNNGLAATGGYNPLYYWDVNSGNATLTYTRSLNGAGAGTVTYSSNNALKMARAGSATRCEIEHEETFEIAAGTKFNINYGYAAHQNTATNPTCTKVTITVMIDTGSTDYYLDWSDGSWSSTASVSEITFTSTGNKSWTTGSVETNRATVAGTLTIRLTDADWNNSVAGNTYFSLSIVPDMVNDTGGVSTKDYEEEIDADSLEDLTKTFYFGDPRDSDSRDILLGSLTIAATGAATDTWKSNAGSVSDTLLELTRDCYQAQYETPARRLQCTLKGTLDYLTVLKDGSDRCYLASSIKRDLKRSELQGEWIEIKTGWGDDLVNGETMVNGYISTDQFDSFAWSGNTATISHSPYSGDATASLTTGPDLTNGTRYRVTISFANVGSSDLPSFDIGGTVITQGELSGTGDNVFEIVSDADYNSHPEVMNHASGDACTALEVTITIEEAYGI